MVRIRSLGGGLEEGSLDVMMETLKDSLILFSNAQLAVLEMYEGR